MNTATNLSREQAADQLMGLAVKGTVNAAVGLFCSLLDGMATMAEEKRMAEKESRRVAMREFFATGQKMRLHQIAEALKMYDASIEMVANELQMPVSELKKSVRPWWSLF